MDPPALTIASIAAIATMWLCAKLDVWGGGMISLLAGLGAYTILKEVFKHKLQQH